MFVYILVLSRRSIVKQVELWNILENDLAHSHMRMLIKPCCLAKAFECRWQKWPTQHHLIRLDMHRPDKDTCTGFELCNILSKQCDDAFHVILHNTISLLSQVNFRRPGNALTKTNLLHLLQPIGLWGLPGMTCTASVLDIWYGSFWGLSLQRTVNKWKCVKSQHCSATSRNACRRANTNVNESNIRKRLQSCNKV